MIEYFNVFQHNKENVIGLLAHDIDADKFAMYIDTTRIPKQALLPQLFGLNQERTPDDRILKMWIADRAIPPYRTNINEVLNYMGLDHYDAWEIMKKCNGENPGMDYWGFVQTDTPNNNWVDQLKFE